MEHVNNSNGLVVEILPEGVSGEAIVNLDFLDSKNSHWATFDQENFSLLWVGTKQGRIHSEAKEAEPVVEANDEQNTVQIFRIVVIIASLCKLHGNSVAQRSRSDTWKADVASELVHFFCGCFSIASDI